MLQIKQNVLFSKVSGDARGHNMLKNLTEDTGQGDGAVVGRVRFIPFFEDKNQYLKKQVTRNSPQGVLVTYISNIDFFKAGNQWIMQKKVNSVEIRGEMTGREMTFSRTRTEVTRNTLF